MLGLKGRIRRLLDDQGMHIAAGCREEAPQCSGLVRVVAGCAGILTLRCHAGLVRRACIPKELIEGQKEKDALQAEKHLTQLEAALREAAGAIQRHDKEMKKMIDRLQVYHGLHCTQQLAGLTCSPRFAGRHSAIAMDTLLDRSKSES